MAGSARMYSTRLRRRAGAVGDLRPHRHARVAGREAGPASTHADQIEGCFHGPGCATGALTGLMLSAKGWLPSSQF